MSQQIVAKYHGVNVIKSCGYYYPEVNLDVELKSIKEVKEWIDDVWMFTQKGVSDLASKMKLPQDLVWNTFTKLHPIGYKCLYIL